MSYGWAFKAVKWALFGVIFSLVPFAGAAILWLAKNGNSGIPFYCYYLWNHGELVVLSAGFAADAVGECFTLRQKLMTVRMVAGGICVCMLFLEATWFAALQVFDNPFTPAAISRYSILLFVVTLIVAAVCKICAAIGESTDDSAAEPTA